MSKQLISMEEILGLLDKPQKIDRAAENTSRLDEYKIKREQQRLLGETLSKTKSVQLSKEIKENLWDKVEQKPLDNSKNAANQISAKIHQRYKKKIMRHWYVSSALVASLLLVMLDFGFFGQAINVDQSRSSYAVLTSQENNATWYVDIQDNNITLIPINEYSKSSGSDLELWAITKTQQVISLGIISDGGVMKLDNLSMQNINASEIETIAISNEKSGGSTTGKPEGKVIYANDVSVRSLNSVRNAKNDI